MDFTSNTQPNAHTNMKHDAMENKSASKIQDIKSKARIIVRKYEQQLKTLDVD